MNRWPYICCLILFESALAKADLNKRDQSIAATLGLAAPVTQIDLTDVGGGQVQAGGPGLAAGLQYLYTISSRFGLGVDFNYLHTGDANSSTVIPHGDSTVNLNSAVFLAMARMNFKANGPVIPFVFSGIGIHSTTLQLNTTPSHGFAWADTGTNEQRAIINDSQSSAAVAFGGGVDVDLSKTVFLGLEGRYDYLGQAIYNAMPNTTLLTGVNGIKGSFGFFNVMARLGFRFGNSDLLGNAAVAPRPSNNTRAPALSPALLPPPSPAAEEPPPPEQTISDFVIAHYSELMSDFAAWHGPTLNSLLDSVARPWDDRLAIAMKIKELSQKYPDIQEFARRVAMLRQ